MRDLPTLENKDDVDTKFQEILELGGEELRGWVDFYSEEWARAALTLAYSKVLW